MSRSSRSAVRRAAALEGCDPMALVGAMRVLVVAREPERGGLDPELLLEQRERRDGATVDGVEWLAPVQRVRTSATAREAG